ncbi:MAG: hypothetical protein ACO29Z_08265 [Crocinitomicaceae bacterium]
MITIEKPNNVVSSGIKNAVSFGIKQEGLAHIFSVLRNQLYSDKILAVIREYSTNAVDAHVEAGKASLPIHVTLPSRFNSVFKVRDFGLGLSEQDIQDIYAFYGESTKRKSNQMIGQLGLGSKSAFAYGDNFVITAFVDGVKTTYNAFIDPSQIGKIAKLASEPTKEENGVEISIAVKDYDVQSFHDKANNLFRYFKVKPVVNGSQVKYDEAEPIMQGVDWKITGKSNTSIAIMGNIGYPIDNHFTSYPMLPTEENITNALTCGIEVDFAIGDLEISASREKLQFTDRTKKAIKDKMTRIIGEVSAELNNRFKSCKTMFDAHKLYGEVMDYGSNLYMLRNLVKSNLVFNGVKINSANIGFNPPTDGSYAVKTYEKTWRGNKVRSYESHGIQCNANTLLVDNDLNISSAIVNRVHTPISNGKKVWLLTYRTPADKAKFFSDTGLIEANFVKLSSLPKISLSTGGTNAVKNTKHSSKEFAYDFDFAANANNWHRKQSDFWKSEDADVSNDSGLYVIIDKFEFKNQEGKFTSPSDLKSIINSLKHFGIDITKVYGFKQKHEVELKDNKNMVNLFDYISSELTIYFNKNKIAQKVADRINYDASVTDWTRFIQKNSGKANADTLFRKTALIADKMQHKSDKVVLDAAVQWKAYYKPVAASNDMAKLMEKLMETYPLFNSISIWRDESDKNKTEAIMQYVNLIDG